MKEYYIDFSCITIAADSSEEAIAKVEELLKDSNWVQENIEICNTDEVEEGE